MEGVRDVGGDTLDLQRGRRHHATAQFGFQCFEFDVENIGIVLDDKETAVPSSRADLDPAVKLWVVDRIRYLVA